MNDIGMYSTQQYGSCYMRAGFILTSLAALQPIHIKITILMGVVFYVMHQIFAQATFETFKLHIKLGL